MGDIAEVRKVNKDESWMDVCWFTHSIFFTACVVPSRSWIVRRERKRK